MSDSQNMSDELRARLRAIPSVNELLAEWPVVKAAGETCDAVVHAAVTAELDEERAAIRAGAAPRSKRDLASAIEWRAHRSALPSLRPAVNATGVVIHTNLGRAPLAESAAKAVAEVARGYSTLEYSVDTCSRGSRKEHAAQLIRSLTGAEDALVVNNNAAAVLLVLATHAAGKEVIVSRGELVEIGGSFRIPDVMAASGAKLVEVAPPTARTWQIMSKPSHRYGHDPQGSSFQLSHRGLSRGGRLSGACRPGPQAWPAVLRGPGVGRAVARRHLGARRRRNHAGFGRGGARYRVMLGR